MNRGRALRDARFYTINVWINFGIRDRFFSAVTMHSPTCGGVTMRRLDAVPARFAPEVELCLNSVRPRRRAQPGSRFMADRRLQVFHAVAKHLSFTPRLPKRCT